jgi:hypothetical protein
VLPGTKGDLGRILVLRDVPSDEQDEMEDIRRRIGELKMLAKGVGIDLQVQLDEKMRSRLEGLCVCGRISKSPKKKETRNRSLMPNQHSSPISFTSSDPTQISNSPNSFPTFFLVKYAFKPIINVSSFSFFLYGESSQYPAYP